MDIDDAVPKSEAAARAVAQLEASLARESQIFDEDHDVIQTIKKSLEKAKQQASEKAVIHDVGQIAGTRATLATHKTKVEEDYEAVIAAETLNVQTLQNQLDLPKQYVAALEQAKSAAIQVINECDSQLVALKDKAEALHGTGGDHQTRPVEIPISPSLDPTHAPIFDQLRTVVQALQDGFTADVPTMPHDTPTQVAKVAQLLAMLPTTTPTSTTTPSTFGPAAASSVLTAARIESQPYQAEPPHTTGTGTAAAGIAQDMDV